MRPTWLVTGGSGFIGQSLLDALNAAPAAPAVVLASRRPPAALAVLPAGARHWPLDLAAPAIALPTGIDTVVHLAGEKREAGHMQAVNHVGAARLVDAAARAGARAFVHLSSVGVYGAGHRAGVVDERTRHTPRGPYETSKDAGERAVRERCAALGLRCIVLQPSNVLGLARGAAGGRPLLGLVRMVARGWFRHIGRGQAWVNYVAVEDVAAALLAAGLDGAAGRAAEGAKDGADGAAKTRLSGHAPGVYIVNTPAPLRSFVGWVADELGLPAPTAKLPAWLATAAAAAGAAGGVVLRRELPLSPARLRELTGTTRFDGRALAGLMPQPYALGIEAALRALVRRYRAEGLV